MILPERAAGAHPGRAFASKVGYATERKRKNETTFSIVYTRPCCKPKAGHPSQKTCAHPRGASAGSGGARRDSAPAPCRLPRGCGDSLSSAGLPVVSRRRTNWRSTAGGGPGPETPGRLADRVAGACAGARQCGVYGAGGSLPRAPPFWQAGRQGPTARRQPADQRDPTRNGKESRLAGYESVAGCKSPVRHLPSLRG